MVESMSARGPEDAADRRRRIVAIVGASSGNLVEWYDFYAYAFTSIYFAHAFFPSGNTTSQLLNTAGIFAVGFFMRPLGGWLFGWLADRHGRRNAMVISVLMMCAGSLLVAVRADVRRRSAQRRRPCCCWRASSRVCRSAGSMAPPPLT